MVLKINDLREVRNYIHPSASSKWYDIGVELGIDVGTLDNIKIQHNNDPSPCLLEMLKGWLRSIIPEPSWKALLDALCTKTVGQEALAQQICDEKGIAFDFSSIIHTPPKGSTSQHGAPSTMDHNPLCKCGEQAVLLTVRKKGPNKGRKFYRCPHHEKKGDCEFFLWTDEATSSSSSQTARQLGSVQEVRRGGAKRRSGKDKSILCDCRKKAVKRKAKKGKDKGKWFYGCSKYVDEENRGCNFFKLIRRCGNCKKLGHDRRSCPKR